MANKKKGDHRLSSIVITSEQKKWMDKEQLRLGQSYSAIVRALVSYQMSREERKDKFEKELEESGGFGACGSVEYFIPSAEQA